MLVEVLHFLTVAGMAELQLFDAPERVFRTVRELMVVAEQNPDEGYTCTIRLRFVRWERFWRGKMRGERSFH